MARLGELKDGGSGRVRLGCSDTVSLYLLPPVLKKFRRKYPAGEVMIRNAYTSEILDLLVRGELDFGIVTKPPSVDRRLEARELFSENFVVACRKDDPLLRRRDVSMDALDGRPMVALEKGTENRDAVDRAFRAAGSRPHVVLETGNIEVQKLYAANGFGFAIIPELAMAALDKRRLEVRPIKGSPIKRSVVVVINRARYVPRPAQALLELVAEAV